MRSGPVGQVKSSMMALVWRCCTELVAESKQQLKEELGRRLSFGAAQWNWYCSTSRRFVVIAEWGSVRAAAWFIIERERVRVPHGSLIIAPSYPVLPPLTSYKQRKSKMGNAGFGFSKNTEEDEKVIPDDHWNCPKIEEIFLLLMTFDVVKMIQRWYKDDTTMIQMN